MDSFFLYITTATALVFVIEGLVYALFPDFVRRLMAVALGMDVAKLRMAGGAMAASGLIMILLLQKLAGG